MPERSTVHFAKNASCSEHSFLRSSSCLAAPLSSVADYLLLSAFFTHASSFLRSNKFPFLPRFQRNPAKNKEEEEEDDETPEKRLSNEN